MVMQTLLRFFILGFFLLSISSVSAQVTIDNQERVLFGNKEYNNGISIVDERTGGTTVGTPFRILRTNNDNVYFTRSTASISSGFAMNSHGGIAMGNLPSTLYPGESALEIYANNTSLYQGLLLNVGSSGPGSALYIEVNPSVVSGTAIHYSGGSTTRSFRVRLDGNVFAQGINITSDASLKREIEVLNNPLEKLMQIRGVSYYMGDNQEENIPFDELLTNMKKSDPKITPEILKQIQAESKRKEIGVIAQEVEKVLPEAISTREDGLKAVSYSDLTVLLIEAVKEQQVVIEKLNARVATLEGKESRSAEIIK
jgi:hypothetical protein